MLKAFLNHLNCVGYVGIQLTDLIPRYHIVVVVYWLRKLSVSLKCIVGNSNHALRMADADNFPGNY